MNNHVYSIERSQDKPKVWTLVISLIVIASTMRAPMTAVGSLISDIRATLQLSNATAGLLTTLPLLAFSVLSPFVPILAKRFGLTQIIAASAIVLTIGITIRSSGQLITLFTGTVIIGLAIAVCNVLLPSFVKTKFPNNIGLMTGVYSVAMSFSGAIASGLSVPLAVQHGFGWQGSLLIWAGLACIAAICWCWQLMMERKLNAKTNKPAIIHNITSPLEEKQPFWKNKLALSITFFMGLQSTIFYVMVSWLPEILQERGMSAEHAGLQLSIIQLSQLPFTLIVPILAGKKKDQRSFVIIMFLLLISSLIGFMYGSVQWVTVASILMGAGGGFAFSLAMMFFTLRTKDAQSAAKLSGMAQSVGYLLAAIGPVLFGKLYDLTNNWTAPLFILVSVAILLFVMGLISGKNQTI
ncbi:CynX/NimT family MFS transporter [Paenibacillus yanchengensis]|uniref:CynX/NimT family MFS transporter n=1 Tax=Paenibacillus yanchengensis TaxID=2035833 RepID=A0ABW4YM68_9BACL